jgi:hypothetical protein
VLLGKCAYSGKKEKKKEKVKVKEKEMRGRKSGRDLQR